MNRNDILEDPRFAGKRPFEKKIAKFAPSDLTSKNEKDEEKSIPKASYRTDEEWVQEYIRQFGEEPSFF